MAEANVVNSDPPKEDKEKEKILLPESKDVTPVHILNMLSFLTEMRAKKRVVSVQLDPLNVMGYGPNDWSFQMLEKCDSRIKVVHTGRDNSALVIIEPLVKATFTGVDSFLQHLLLALKEIEKRGFSIYIEPCTQVLNGHNAVDPEALGIPIQDLCAHETAHERVIHTIEPFCRPVRDRNPNYSNGFVAEALDFSPLRTMASEVSLQEMRPLRMIYVEYERAMNLGKVDQHLYPVLLPNDHLNVVANPFNLNELFTCLPMGVRYSTEIVMEILCPEVSVTPIPPSQLLVHASQSTSRLTTLNSFSSINERPMMDQAIGFYMMSLLCPGTINFAINFDDIPQEDIYLRALAALSSKLLFSYSEIDRRRSS